MIYSNLVSLSETWISRGRIPPLVGLTGVHLLMLTVLVLLFAWRLGLLRRVSLRPAPA